VSSLSSYGPLIAVDDCLTSLVDLGVAARARLSSDARVIAVTGSVGKTGTKEALRLVLSKQGPTHASVASYNNHFGVPLTLARMPEATKFGIFEIGMNHAGEIEPLTRQVRPHVALITTVEAVHIENFPNVEAIADENRLSLSDLKTVARRSSIAIIRIMSECGLMHRARKPDAC